jgi:hypothetical protein
MGAASIGNVSVGRVMLEELGFSLESLSHGLVALNILLGAVHNTNEAKLEGVNAARENVECIGTMVHKINLGQNTNCASTEGIDMAGKFESFGVDEIDVGWGDSEDNTVRLGDVF